MKDTFYFSHDYNARHDEKTKRLIRKYGMRGYGIFWALIEDLYNNSNSLEVDYEGSADDLRCTPDIIKSIINDFDLFSVDAEYFCSDSVERRIKERLSQSEKGRELAYQRWHKDEKQSF